VFSSELRTVVHNVMTVESRRHRRCELGIKADQTECVAKGSPNFLWWLINFRYSVAIMASRIFSANFRRRRRRRKFRWIRIFGGGKEVYPSVPLWQRQCMHRSQIQTFRIQVERKKVQSAATWYINPMLSNQTRNKSDESFLRIEYDHLKFHRWTQHDGFL